MKKLYDQDAHLLDFEAGVEECRPLPDGNHALLLDQTAFFPEEGGQGPDGGTLDRQKVLDVQIKNNLVWHTVTQPVEPGTRVQGHVDWTRRFDYMQQHTGEHIISGLVHAKYGFDNVGFHLGEEEVTLDFNGVLDLEQMREIEEEANRAVWRNLPVICSFPEPEVLANLSYRSKLALTENVRIVEIPGVDVCACCAPHVDATGQIGLIKVTGLMNHRGGVRVNILCGERALKDYTLRQNSVSAISVLLSARQEAVAEAVEKLKADNLQARLRASGLQAKLLEFQVAALPSPETAADAVLFTGELDNLILRNTVNDLAARYPGFAAVFSGSDEQGYRFIIGSASRDCRELAKGLRERLGAKGGGTTPMVQGSIAAQEAQIREALSQI